jgi:DNA (cytosine-5)-methyltransferase 1
MIFEQDRPYVYDLEYLRSQSNKNLFNVVSLFAGGGGSSTGYRLAGGKVLAINEFIPAAQNVYKSNYPDTYIFPGDIRQLTGKEILETVGIKKGELDILDGSPPCSSFSVAGLGRKGWGRIKSYSDSSQRTDDLFFEFVRILDEVQPKVFVAENVKGLTIGVNKELLGSEQLNIFNEQETTIFNSLSNKGYTVRYKVLNSNDYGVPQSRERVIFIGVRNDILKNNPDLVISYPKFNRIEKDSVYEATKDLIYSGNICAMSEAYKKNWEKCLPGESFFAMGKRTGKKESGVTRKRLNKNEPSSTVVTGPELFHWDECRTLTIEEVKRISSFPSDYIFGNISNNKKWERMGRAVPPLMMKEVAENVFNTILKKINIL